MSALYYFGIIEGALHQRGEDAFSITFWHALKMLRSELKAPNIIEKQPDKRIDAKSDEVKDLANKIMDAAKLEIRCNGGIDSADDKTNGWADWQLNLLKEMKDKGETASAIAKATEKTTTQVHNKWYQLKPRKIEGEHAEY